MMILFMNGSVVDGSGQPAQSQSVLIQDGKIKEVGTINPSPEMATVDCSGLVISSGFVDVHSHCDLEALEHRAEKVKQGVTTEVVGNCGFSLFPQLPRLSLVPSSDIFDRRGRKDW